MTASAQRAAIVTGAGSGIGAAVASQLLDHDVAVVRVDREFSAPILGGSERGRDVVGDVADAATISAALDVAEGCSWRVGVLVNSAGVAHDALVEDSTIADWNRVLATNLTSMYHACQAVALRMVADGAGGAIVNIASVHAWRTNRAATAYAASKGGCVAFTRALALDLAPHGVRVNSVSPGAIDTPLLRRSAAVQRPDAVDGLLAEWAARQPLGRLGTSADVASAVCFLASDEAAFITGTDLVVDGGLLASF